MKEYESKTIKCNGYENMLYKIGKTAEALLENCETEEEKAFLLGHINATAAVLASKHHNGHCAISFEYKDVKKAYEISNTKEDDDEKYHQISIEEFLDEVKKEINKLIKNNKKKV